MTFIIKYDIILNIKEPWKITLIILLWENNQVNNIYLTLFREENMKRKKICWIQFLSLLGITCAGCLKMWWYCYRINMSRSTMIGIAFLLAICFLFGFAFIFYDSDKITRREIQNQWIFVLVIAGLVTLLFIA